MWRLGMRRIVACHGGSAGRKEAAPGPGETAPVASSRPYTTPASTSLDLLSAPLTIPLVCCHSKSFRRASRCGEARARRRKAERRAGIASRGMCSDGVVAPLVCGHRGVPAHGVVPERCHSSGAAVDDCRDTTAGAQRSECVADGGVVDIPRALSGSPSVPPIPVQRGARFHPYRTRDCLPLQKLRREIQ
jgi:hypothetical protein